MADVKQILADARSWIERVASSADDPRRLEADKISRDLSSVIGVIEFTELMRSASLPDDLLSIDSPEIRTCSALFRPYVSIFVQEDEDQHLTVVGCEFDWDDSFISLWQTEPIETPIIEDHQYDRASPRAKRIADEATNSLDEALSIDDIGGAALRTLADLLEDWHERRKTNE